MKLNRVIYLIFILIFSINVFAKSEKERININFKNLKIEDLVKITSKIINKNILITNNIKGTVDFISNKPVYKDDVINILIYILEDKGYTLIENNDILRIVRLSDAVRYNLPIYTTSKSISEYQMLTEVFSIDNINVDYVTSKIRHLVSKNAKLVTDKESNSVIITDFYENITTIKEVINLIAKDNQKTIEIVELKNLQASSIVPSLQNVAKTVFDEKIEKEKVSILLNKDNNSVLFVGKKRMYHFL